MQELLKQFVALDAAMQLAIMAAFAGIVVRGLRACGLDQAPGYQSVLASVGVGAATGFATNGWQGLVLGALAGFVATGVHQSSKQWRERVEDGIDEEEAELRLGIGEFYLDEDEDD